MNFSSNLHFQATWLVKIWVEDGFEVNFNLRFFFMKTGPDQVLTDSLYIYFHIYSLPTLNFYVKWCILIFSYLIALQMHITIWEFIILNFCYWKVFISFGGYVTEIDLFDFWLEYMESDINTSTCFVLGRKFWWMIHNWSVLDGSSFLKLRLIYTALL